MATATYFSSRFLPTVAGAGGPLPRPKVDEARSSCAPLRSVALDSALAASCNRCLGPRESSTGFAGLEELLNRRIQKTFHEIDPFLQLPIHFFKLGQMVAKLLTVLVRQNLLARYHTATALLV